MLYVFGDCVVDTQQHELRVSGAPVKIQHKVYQLLLYLIEHRDRLVTKQELLEHIWPETYVEENAVARCISGARRVVGDQRNSQHVIQTTHGQGYRFVASVVTQRSASIEPSISILPSEPLAADTLPTQSVLQIPGGERKLVTMLAGVVTPALHEIEALTLDSQHAWVTALTTMAREVTEPYGGALSHVLDGRFSVVFGVPQAYEDHAQRALLAALSMQQRWSSFMLKHSQPTNTKLALGVGLHTGEVAVDDDGGDSGRPLTVVCETPSVATHLAQKATPGTVLLSSATAQLVSAVVALEVMPPLMAAGQTAALSVFRVQNENATPLLPAPRWERYRSRFVGRKRELTTLLAGWTRTQQGQSQIIGVIGEAGMGKSRLLEEFRQAMVGQAVTYLAGRCESYGQNTPYLPLKALIEQACGLHKADGMAVRMSKIHARLQALGLTPAYWGPWLNQLLGELDPTDLMALVGPQERRARTFEALHYLLIESSRHQALVLEVENLHWIDTTSEAYLAELAKRLTGTPILLLVTYRAGYQPPWGAASNVMQLPLAPLTPRDGKRIVQGILEHKRVTVGVIEQVVARAQGNPLFLEELAQTVREVESEPLLKRVPDTIQTVLISRIDRLSPAAKRLLQTAAVIGPEVQEWLLQALVSLPQDVFHQQLSELQAREMLYGIRLMPEPIYTFKHVLIREAAYQSLLESMRQHLHQQIAHVLERRFLEMGENQPELLARHYTEAGLTEQAVDYWQQAGQHAVKRSAHAEAIRHFRKGLEVLQTRPDTPERTERELILLIALGAALMVIHGYGSPEAEYVYSQARMLCQKIEGSPHLFSALWGYNRVCHQRAKYQIAREVGEQLLTSAEQMQDSARLLEAHFALGAPLFWMGETQSALAHMEAGRKLYNPVRHRALMHHSGHDHEVGYLTYEARALWFLGYPDRALSRIYEARSRAGELSHPFSQARALVFVTALHQYRREVVLLRERADELLALARPQDFALWMAIGTIMWGWVVTMQGQSEGVVELCRGLENKRAIGSEMGQSYFLSLLAEAYAQVGDPEEGLTALNAACAFADQTGERFYDAELHRLKGQLLLQMSSQYQSEAADAFQNALSIARNQQAKSLELRAATSLACLWQQQGQHEKARNLLAPVYCWFTEGFNTLDLQKARSLLDSLT